MDAEVYVWLGGAAFVVGYLIINQVVLRLVLLFGTALYMVYYFVAADEPLWGAIYTTVFTLTANLIGLALLFLRRAGWMLPPRFRDLRDRFGTIPPGDLRAVLRHARREVLEADKVLTREGQPVDTLDFVLSGRVHAEKLGEGFRIPHGVFVGEVAYLTRARSSATVRVEAGAEIVSWPIEKLHRQAAKNPRAKLALEAIVSRDLAAKVSLAVAPKSLPPGLITD